MVAHQGEVRQIHANGPGRGALADHDVDGKVLHGGIEHLLHLPGKAVDLVNKQHVPRRQVAEDGGQVPGPVNGRAGGNADVLPHLRGHNAGQGGFAQARRAIEQHMVQGVVPGQRRLDVDAQAVLHRLLPHILPQGVRAEALLHGAVLLPEAAGHQSIFCHGSPHIPAMLRRASLISSSVLSLWSRTLCTALRASAGV